MSAHEEFATSLGRAQTSQLHDRVRSHRIAGKEVMAVGGIPPWPPPSSVFARAHERLMSGLSMPPVLGLPSLREAIARKRRASFGAHVTADEVLVTNGAKDAIHLTLSALCPQGSHVMVPLPNYPYYGNCEVLGLDYQTIPEDGQSGKPDIDRLLEIIAEVRPRVVITSSPINPTGYVWPLNQLQALLQTCRRYGTWLILDESFEELVSAPARQVSGDWLRRQGYSRLVTLHSFSKGYGMQWARIGYMVGGPELVQVTGRLQEWTTLRVNAFSQYLAEEALASEEDGWLTDAIARSAVSRKAVRDALSATEGIRVASGSGGGSVFVYLDRVSIPTTEMADLLLEKDGIVAFPGAIFGSAAEALRIPAIGDPEAVADMCSRLTDRFKISR